MSDESNSSGAENYRKRKELLKGVTLMPRVAAVMNAYRNKVKIIFKNEYDPNDVAQQKKWEADGEHVYVVVDDKGEIMWQSKNIKKSR